MAYWVPPRSVQRDLRNELRRYIRETKHLVDTGLMWESTEVEAEIDRGGTMTITVYSTNYLKYQWDKERLYEFPRKQTIENAYAGWILKKMKEEPMRNWKNVRADIQFDLKD